MKPDMLTLRQAAHWCGGKVAPQFGNTPFSGVSYHSKNVRPGELFAALAGARDGHAFIRDALDNGAAAVLASKSLPPDIPAIYVSDTLSALQEIAHGYREQLNFKCVGITGSVGKTTTKEMTAAVLATTFRTLKTEKNYNNEIGLPVTVLSAASDCEAAVLEMGMNHFGEISALTRIAQPDIAVITNIGTSHIENLGSREGILRAKLEILEGLRPGGLALFHAQSDLLRAVAKEHHAVCFGQGGEVFAKEITADADGTQFTAVAYGTQFPVRLCVPGEHNVTNALAAIAVGLHCGVSQENIRCALEAFQNTGMRQHIYRVRGLTMIEDCYNAGPESMCAALKVLAGFTGRKIAVLGGMLELGAFAPEAHYAVGKQSASAAQLLLTYGENSEHYIAGAIDAGMKPEDTHHFTTHEELAAALRECVTDGDILLVKGSRAMRMERVLQLLFEDAES